QPVGGALDGKAPALQVVHEPARRAVLLVVELRMGVNTCAQLEQRGALGVDPRDRLRLQVLTSAVVEVAHCSASASWRPAPPPHPRNRECPRSALGRPHHHPTARSAPSAAPRGSPCRLECCTPRSEPRGRYRAPPESGCPG